METIVKRVLNDGKFTYEELTRYAPAKGTGGGGIAEDVGKEKHTINVVFHKFRLEMGLTRKASILKFVLYPINGTEVIDLKKCQELVNGISFDYELVDNPVVTVIGSNKVEHISFMYCCDDKYKLATLLLRLAMFPKNLSNDISEVL